MPPMAYTAQSPSLNITFCYGCCNPHGCSYHPQLTSPLSNAGGAITSNEIDVQGNYPITTAPIPDTFGYQYYGNVLETPHMPGRMLMDPVNCGIMPSQGYELTEPNSCNYFGDARFQEIPDEYNSETSIGFDQDTDCSAYNTCVKYLGPDSGEEAYASQVEGSFEDQWAVPGFLEPEISTVNQANMPVKPPAMSQIYTPQIGSQCAAAPSDVGILTEAQRLAINRDERDEFVAAVIHRDMERYAKTPLLTGEVYVHPATEEEQKEGHLLFSQPQLDGDDAPTPVLVPIDTPSAPQFYAEESYCDSNGASTVATPRPTYVPNPAFSCGTGELVAWEGMPIPDVVEGDWNGDVDGDDDHSDGDGGNDDCSDGYGAGDENSNYGGYKSRGKRRW
ncbi:hypothetical protein I7I53_02379 [Histoplasma capsulatum var. duboisii H88]|uniref:Uncharacterized protein n=2 Tax=Ajellomyces capsulatus (strain H88) TaxID=544711 RepID=A0A8A1LMS1_AJEC8|nr:hypothetical protein I7I53_02379 [Histoplasma capsulatum var. duboisii H88]